MPRKRKLGDVHGWVAFNKPRGLTSTQSIGKVRRLMGAGKAGHAGTLDPMATGILPIALGEGTKTVSYMVDADKAYDFTVTWGENTDSWDAEGEVTATSDVRPILSDITAALPEFVGDISQIPPRYSAIKVDGKRAYDLMRSGEDVTLKARTVRVDSLSVLEHNNDSVTLRVECGKGTYVRSIARDLAARLGTCGHVTYLHRTRVGAFHEGISFSLDALEKLHYESGVSTALLPVETALDDIPVLAITQEQSEHLKHGRAIVAPDIYPTSENPDAQPQTNGRVVAMYQGRALALCDVTNGEVRPKRVFNMSI